MRRTLLRIVPLIVALSASALSQTMVEYGGLAAKTATGTAKAAGAVSKAGDTLGKRMGDAIGDASSRSPAAEPRKQSTAAKESVSIAPKPTENKQAQNDKRIINLPF